MVNISSIVGTHGSAGGNLAYSVSKAGMNLFTINTALELAQYGIRVNAVKYNFNILLSDFIFKFV